MRLVSLNARLAHDAQSSREIEVVLMSISHPALEKPIRLSTDNTVRLSEDPLYYGTRSTVFGANPATEPYLWIAASTLLPSDEEDVAHAGNIVLSNLDREIVRLLRSYSDYATLHIAVVLASTPNVIEVQFRDLNITSASITGSDIVITFSRRSDEEEYAPAGRMTKRNTPGLHK